MTWPCPLPTSWPPPLSTTSSSSWWARRERASASGSSTSKALQLSWREWWVSDFSCERPRSNARMRSAHHRPGRKPPSCSLKGPLLILSLGVYIHSPVLRVHRKAGADRAWQAGPPDISRRLVVPFQSRGQIPRRWRLCLPHLPLDRWQPSAPLQRGNRFGDFFFFRLEAEEYEARGANCAHFHAFQTFTLLKPWESLKTPTFWGGTVESRSWRKGRKTIGEDPCSSFNFTTLNTCSPVCSFLPAGMCMQREFPTSWRLKALFLCLVRSASPSPSLQSSILLPQPGESIDLYWKECCVFSLYRSVYLFCSELR